MEKRVLEKNTIIGEWKSERAEVKGAFTNFTAISMKFRNDGKVVFSVENVSDECEWKLNGGKIVIEDYEMTMEDNEKLVQEEDGTRIYFKKAS